MLNKVNNWFKNIGRKIKDGILKYYKTVLKSIIIILIITSAWMGFLYLVGNPPIETTPALIMVWLSVLILFFSLYPKIFDRIKRLKLKDFEIELNESVKKSTVEEDYISMVEVDDYVFSQKGDFRNLTDIIKQARRNPDKPILLTVNLRDGDYISIPMLFIYLFFLDLFGNTINLLILSSRRSIHHFSDISKNSIVGVISGKKVLRIFYDRFPRLFRIYEFERFSNIKLENFFRRDFFREYPNESLFRHCYEFLRENRDNFREFLTEEDVLMWFGKDINRRIIDLDNIESNQNVIKSAMEKDDEFLIILKDNTFRSITALCKVTKNISLKVLENIKK